MFLFRTSAPSEATPATPVMQAIRQGADRTGTDFDYLVRTAQRESSLDPQAKARTSSASGLFQFIEQTWLSMVRSEGARHGLDDQAKSIQQGADGRLVVPDPKAREQIMALRHDPEVAATMAGAFTQRNREQLMGALGREPTGGELYIAHVLGARGATELIGAAQSAPQRSAAKDFPEAAAANRPIFFDKSGRARSMAEVYASLSAAHADIARAVGSAPAAGEPSGQPRGLFATRTGSSPVSEAVARLWTGRARIQLASLEPQQRFFPSGDGQAAMDAAAPAEADKPALRQVSAPTPPERPLDLAAPDAGRSRTRRSHKPLDLNAFLRADVAR